MSPKTTPNAERPSVDRLAAFARRVTVSTAMLDKEPNPAIVKVLHSDRSRSTSAIYWQAEKLLPTGKQRNSCAFLREGHGGLSISGKKRELGASRIKNRSTCID